MNGTFASAVSNVGIGSQAAFDKVIDRLGAKNRQIRCHDEREFVGGKSAQSASETVADSLAVRPPLRRQTQCSMAVLADRRDGNDPFDLAAIAQRPHRPFRKRYPSYAHKRLVRGALRSRDVVLGTAGKYDGIHDACPRQSGVDAKGALKQRYSAGNSKRS